MRKRRKYVQRFTDMQWNPRKSNHVISPPQKISDPVALFDQFTASVMRWWGLEVLLYDWRK